VKNQKEAPSSKRKASLTGSTAFFKKRGKEFDMRGGEGNGKKKRERASAAPKKKGKLLYTCVKREKKEGISL